MQLIQGLNSAMNPKGMSQGKVTKSTNPAVPVGSMAMMGLGSDPANGGSTVKLLQLGISGKMVPVASSAVVLAPDFFNKGLELSRNKNAPKDSASGAYVFLPERMIVRFTLTTPPPPELAAQRPPQRPAETKPKAWMMDTVGETADSAAVSVNIAEQGAMHGEVFEDLSKKWGKPAHLPPGYNNELGTSDRATWGDKKTVYAEYQPSIYSFGGQNVTIYDAVALAPHTQERKGVPM